MLSPRKTAVLYPTIFLVVHLAVTGCTEDKNKPLPAIEAAQVSGQWLQNKTILSRQSKNNNASGEYEIKPTDGMQLDFTDTHATGYESNGTRKSCMDNRPYRMDNRRIVFDKQGACEEYILPIESIGDNNMSINWPQKLLSYDVTVHYKRIAKGEFDTLLKEKSGKYKTESKTTKPATPSSPKIETPSAKLPKKSLDEQLLLEHQPNGTKIQILAYFFGNFMGVTPENVIRILFTKEDYEYYQENAVINAEAGKFKCKMIYTVQGTASAYLRSYSVFTMNIDTVTENNTNTVVMTSTPSGEQNLRIECLSVDGEYMTIADFYSTFTNLVQIVD